MSNITENIAYEDVIAVRQYIVDYYENNSRKCPNPQVIADSLGFELDHVHKCQELISYDNDMLYYKSKAGEVVDNLFNLTKNSPQACEKFLQLVGWKPNAEVDQGDKIIFVEYV